jgi:hypothetical protein
VARARSRPQATALGFARSCNSLFWDLSSVLIASNRNTFSVSL